MLKMVSSLHHFCLISHSRIGQKHANESLVLYKNHVLLYRLYEILSLICFNSCDTKKIASKYMNLYLLEDNLFSYQYNYGILAFKG